MKKVYIVISRENYFIACCDSLQKAEIVKQDQIKLEEFQGGRPSVWIKETEIK